MTPVASQMLLVAPKMIVSPSLDGGRGTSGLRTFSVRL